MKTKIITFLVLPFMLMAVDPKWESYKKHTVSLQGTVHGWCNPKKALGMMNLIYETKPRVCVEIGVFGGSSIYPTAKALKYNNRGIVYAIDPWKNADCLEGYDKNDPNYKWWNEVDLNEIYALFQGMLRKHQLRPFCRTMRTTSESALEHFKENTIDILHIDGNHSEDSAYFDAINWLPLVKPGGYIWFDDVNWTSTNKAINYLLEHCELLKKRCIGNECYLFRKN